MTTPEPPTPPEPDRGPAAAGNTTPPESPTDAEPEAAGALVGAGASDGPSVEAAVDQTTPEVALTTPRHARRAPAWAWVAIVLMALLLAIGLASLAVARNTEPSTPEAVEDVQTLVAELETLNASLATTNELMSNAISNAAQLSAKAQAKLASLSTRFSDVDVGVGQVRSLLGDQLSRPTRSELGDLQAQLQSLQETLAQRNGRLEGLELAGLRGNVAAIDREAGIESNRGSRRTGAIEADVATLENKLAENEGANDQVAELLASLQAQRNLAQALRAELFELRRTHAAQLLQLKRALAVLKQRVDSLTPGP